MKLSKIFDNINYKLIKGTLDLDISGIEIDSRKIKPGNIFVAIKGFVVDGHNYIDKAIENGATCIIVDREVSINQEVTIIMVDNSRDILPVISASFYEYPQDKLKKIGITGTKGKTSTAFMIKKLLESAGKKVGMIGTLGVYIGDKHYEDGRTTPESLYIQKYMKEMVDAGIEYLAMEVSSQALKYGRVTGIVYDYAIFTNLSEDHIGPNEHPTYEDYIESKSKLFRQSKVGLINKDDAEFAKIVNNATCKIITYGERSMDADIKIDNIEAVSNKSLKTNFNLTGKINGQYSVNMPGHFSAFNATCAIAAAFNFIDFSEKNINDALDDFMVPGRCNIYNTKRGKVVIDFAHNKISLTSIVDTLKQYNPDKIITVFGCGGGRMDRRFSLGETSGELSDLSIVTTDNPRDDDIDEINRDIVRGIESKGGKYIIIKDRGAAIRYAIDNMQPNDIVLLIGKGDEEYQEIKGQKYPFSEKSIVLEYM